MNVNLRRANVGECDLFGLFYFVVAYAQQRDLLLGLVCDNIAGSVRNVVSASMNAYLDEYNNF